MGTRIVFPGLAETLSRGGRYPDPVSPTPLALGLFLEGALVVARSKGRGFADKRKAGGSLSVTLSRDLSLLLILQSTTEAEDSHSTKQQYPLSQSNQPGPESQAGHCSRGWGFG